MSEFLEMFLFDIDQKLSVSLRSNFTRYLLSRHGTLLIPNQPVRVFLVPSLVFFLERLLPKY